MKSFSISTVFIFLIFVGTLSAQSDEERRFIDLSKVPTEAAFVAEFVPTGWQIEKQINGNINFDSKPDAILQLVESEGTQDEDRYRALLVLTPTENGKWLRIAAADRLLDILSTGSMKCGSQGDEIEIKLSGKGVLTVYQCLGGVNLITYTHRFRYEAASKRIRLIGADSENGSPASQITMTSINYLTGVKITTRIDYAHPKGITKRGRVSTGKKIYLEEVDNEVFQENGI